MSFLDTIVHTIKGILSGVIRSKEPQIPFDGLNTPSERQKTEMQKESPISEEDAMQVVTLAIQKAQEKYTSENNHESNPTE